MASLVMRHVSGSRAALDRDRIEHVYRERFARFWRAMAAIIGNSDDAREAVQEGFARALAARRTYRGEGSVEAWIWRIALNAALEKRRHPIDLPLERAFALELPRPEYDPTLNDALRLLPPQQRVLIFLYYLADLSYDEISRICDITPGAVGASLWKARRSLATLLGDELRPPSSAATERRARHE